MPISTNLSGAPSFDDYDPTKDFYKVLFQPGVSVQVRELNQLQSILQNQIEKFGDNIFKQGTIITGCNFSFLDYFPYCKIADSTTGGTSTNPGLYKNLYVKNTNNLTAYVVDTLDGYEITDPDLKTLYLNYINSGDSQSDDSFTAGDTLTVYSPNNCLFGVLINSGSSGFSNNDRIEFSSALEVTMLSGTFSNGDYLINPTSGANVQIIGLSTNSVSNTVTINVKPRATDLANSSLDSTAWTFSLQDVIKNSSNTATGKINFIYGSGAKGGIITNSVGKVTDTVLIEPGDGYTILPYTTIRSANNSAGITDLNLTSKNYLATVKIPAIGSAVGNGYAFAVSNGVIYQKGFFLNVDAQRIIVEKYSQYPNNVSVGFETTEEIITSNIDSTLLDNALGTRNETAPGANRLKLTPKLFIQDTDVARANNDFLTLVEWNDGKPYKQNKTTQYSVIGKEMAKRTYDSSGNFVLDTFYVTTDSTANAALESQYYTAVVDPGTAYIGGYKTETTSNYRINVPKGTDTKITKGQRISLNYDTYVRLKEVGGLFQFSTGDLVQIYDAPKTFLSNTTLLTTANTTPQGNQIGTARIRSMNLESGTPGDATAIYRLSVFNIQMNAGKNFKNARSLYYNGSAYVGIADIVTELDATTGSTIAKVYGINNDSLVFKTGLESIRNTNNSIYIYRTIDQTSTVGNNGILTKSVASNPNEVFPYSGNLSSSQLLDLVVVPLSNNLVGYTSLTGNCSVNTTSANMIGTGTTFIADLQAGDYVTIAANSSVTNIKKIVSVVNNSLAILDSNCSFSNTNCLNYRTFPKNLPVPFGPRSGLTANVNSNNNVLVLNFGTTFAGTTSTNCAIAYNVQKTNTTSTSKTANRNQFVKILASNNAGGMSGPWCLGVSDVFRLRNVFIGNSTVNTASVKITDEFYIDHNQNSDYLDLSYLYKRPKSSLVLANTDYLLVQFDYFTSSDAGYKDTVSYLHTSNSAQIASIDSSALSSLTDMAASFEVPEINTSSGETYDLLNCIDFRPAVVNTIATSITANAAVVNPPYALSFGNTADPSNTKKFPLPNSLFTTDIEYYLGRTDTIVIGPDSNIVVSKGPGSADPSKRYEPNISPDSLKLQNIIVPPYPNITKKFSDRVLEIIDTKTINEVQSGKRLTNHQINPTLNANNIALNQPKAYTAEETAKLERRIKTLEYYQGLSTLETSITNKVIPSSIDGSINRFKFGFFVDDFSTKIYSDLTNPQYSTSIEAANSSQTNVITDNTIPELASNLLIPGKFVFGLKHVVSDFTIGHSDHLLVTQTNITEPIAPCSINPIIKSGTNTSSVNSYFYQVSQAWITGPTTYWKIKLSTKQGGHCQFYYDVFVDPKFTIYKNGVEHASTISARPISDSEYDFLTSSPYTKAFFAYGVVHPWGLKHFYKDSIGNVLGGGTFEFDHDPSTGSEYEIKVTFPVGMENPMNQAIDEPYQYLLIAPVDSTTGSGNVVDACGGLNTVLFNGTMIVDSQLNISQTTSLKNYDFIKIKCSGLKPLTQHYFFGGGTQLIDTVKQVGKNFTDPLTTDEYGKINLELYFIPNKTGTNSLDALNQFVATHPATWDAKFGQFEFNTGSSNYLLELKAVGSSCVASVNFI